MMKKLLFFLGANIIFINFVFSQGISINTSGKAADSSAILDVSSTKSGVLIPRMTTSERNFINSPAESLMIFNSDTKCFESYVNGAWYSISCPCTPPSGAGNITGSSLVCLGSNGVVFSIPEITNVTTYIWTYTGNGFFIVSGAGTNSITVDFSNDATTGTLTVYGTNDCGGGAISPGYNITVVASSTPISNAGEDQIVSQVSTTTLSANTPQDGTGTWGIEGGIGGSFSNINDPASSFSGKGGETYILVWTVSNTCGTFSDTVKIAFARRVFVTSLSYNGDLGGLSGADSKCQVLANTQLLGGTWKAWLSTSNPGAIDAASRLNHSNAPYVLINGSKIADNWADLIDWTLSHGINIDETGITTSGGVWTNTMPDGTVSYLTTEWSCNSWTTSSSAVSYHGSAGNAGATDYFWTTGNFKMACTSQFRLYCFEQ